MNDPRSVDVGKGEEVNTAARLASKAAVGEIIVSEQAIKAAGINGNQLDLQMLAPFGSFIACFGSLSVL